jgi:hypothetical protein
MSKKKGGWLDVKSGAAWDALSPERQTRALKALMTSDNIVPAMRAKVADSVLAERSKHKAVQREKARRPRGAGTDGRTMRELIAGVAKANHGLKPLELLPHVNSAAIDNGMKPISVKRLGNVLAELASK